MQISDTDFQRLVQFLQKNYGIDLSKKRPLIVARLSYTLQTMGYSSFSSFIDHLLKTKRPNDVELVINKLTTNYTFFMREEAHFSFFKHTILPEIVQKHKKDRVLSIWCAGCSSGEEAYTMAMYVRDFLGAQASIWDARILATDISQQALALAKEAVYDLPDTIPPAWKRRYFQPIKGSTRFQVVPELRDQVILRNFNLMDPIRMQAKFDVIFCRNVMIYFDTPTKDALVQRFYSASAPGSYLLIGHSETIRRDIGYEFLSPATFRKP